MDDAPATGPPAAVVVVPVKSFGRAKGRLAGALDAPARAELARWMADRVVDAAAPLGVLVVCDDDAVADWARRRRAEVAWTPGLGLNGAVDAALGQLERRGVARAVVAHADLPFATGLAALADAGSDEVLLVPDRHGDGSNVWSVPLGRGLRAGYGPGSAGRHAAAARDAGLRVRLVDAEALRWDVDGPADLSPPAHLGRLPVPAAGSAPGAAAGSAPSAEPAP